MITKDVETFSFPSEAAPLMVLFDKGGHALKTAAFHKEKREWLYQLKNATEFADRADAVIALGKLKNDDEVVAALATALNSDQAWGIRAVSADALGRTGGSGAFKHLVDALKTNDLPAVRYHIVGAIGEFKNEASAPPTLETVARDDRSYRARASALQALGHLKSPNAFGILTDAVKGESPDGFLRNAALRSLGFLGDDMGVPLLREWSAPGKAMDSRSAAIASLGRVDKGNRAITRQIASYLTEPHFTIRWAAISALGNRGDASAIPALEALLKSVDLSIEMVPEIKGQIEKLQKSQAAKAKGHNDQDDETQDEDSDKTVGGMDQVSVSNRLEQLERIVQEMNNRLKGIESRLALQPKN
jgi:HEAT repeat protein